MIAKRTQPPSGGCVLKQHRAVESSTLGTQPPSGGCVLKLSDRLSRQKWLYPAAFRRLCVETLSQKKAVKECNGQPPSGGCVLKQQVEAEIQAITNQPPSGGCVLKQLLLARCFRTYKPAAFRRLCVETANKSPDAAADWPAAFRRLCVETVNGLTNRKGSNQPPSGGCVLKPLPCRTGANAPNPAAFRRLCVETSCCCPSPRPQTPAAFRRLCVET